MLPIVRSRPSRLALAAMLVSAAGPALSATAQTVPAAKLAPKPPSAATISVQQASAALLPREDGRDAVELHVRAGFCFPANAGAAGRSRP